MAFTFKVKKRCRFCGTALREDGTCPNEKCPRYVEEKTEDNTSTGTTSTGTNDTTSTTTDTDKTSDTTAK